MAEISREVSLAIGVGDAKPLVYLGGVVNGAHAFHDWASQLGYESRILTDEDNRPVTMARLRSELESILNLPGPIHRLLLYFAGHGLIREAEEGLWLLSDWHKELRAVAVEVLKRRLYMHNIKQIGIFADSCRSLPPNITAADLTPDGVLGRGPNQEPKQPAIDRFIAAQDGSATFVVPGATPEEDRCLFSGVLMEGLWGLNTEAFSTRVTDKVTSQSLGTYLGVEVPKRAESYKRKLFPSVNPTFPENDDIYFSKGGGPKPPAFPAWPSLSTVIGMEPCAVEDEAVRKLEREKPISEAVSTQLVEKLRSQPRPITFETGAGFAVQGGLIRDFWTPPDVFADQRGASNWWRVGSRGMIGWLQKPAPLLIEFNDGKFAAVTALPQFIATALRDERGIMALIYRPAYEAPDTAPVAERAIAKMESGALRANDATDLAVDLRQMKHVDPVLGVISAYLYDSIGDIDNIRRMAFYYVENHQPIPYDIALLAQLEGEWSEGGLKARVPPVNARKPRTEAEKFAEWTYSKTPEVTGEVGGFWPWMRQGWAFLTDPIDANSSIIKPELIELNSHLAATRFATLDAKGAQKLAEIFKLAKNAQLAA